MNPLRETQILLDKGEKSDGCTSPFKTFIHRILKRSRILCAVHDFGLKGLLTGVEPGWHTNWITWLVHLKEPNPIYWIWGTIVSLVTLPWVIWNRNLGIKTLSYSGFYIILSILLLTIYLITVQPGRY